MKQLLLGLGLWAILIASTAQVIPFPLPIQLPANSPYIQDFNNTPGDSGLTYPAGWTAYNKSIWNPVLIPGTWLSMSSLIYNYGGKIGMIGDSATNNPGYFVLALCNTSERAEIKISYDVVKQWEALFANSRLELEYSLESPTSGFKPVQGTTYNSGFRIPTTTKKFTDIPLPLEMERRNRRVWLRWKYTVTSNAWFSGNHDGIAIDNIKISWMPATPRIDLGQDTTICPGGFLTLDASVLPGESPTWLDTLFCSAPSALPVSYLWSTGDTTPKTTITAPGTYWISATNANGTSRDTIQVVEKPFEVFLGNDTTVCGGMLLDAGFPNAAYIWNTSENTQRVWADVSHWYHVRVVTPGGCVGEDSIYVTVAPPIELDLGQDRQICQWGSVRLEAAIDSSYSYWWSNGSTSYVIEASEPGLYWVEVTSPSCVARDSVMVSAISLGLNLGDDREICQDEPLYAGGGYANYIWSDGSTLPWLYPQQSGIYYVTVTNELGCSQSDSVAITLHVNAPTTLLAPDTVTLGERVAFYATPTGIVENWYWDFGNGSFTFSPDSAFITYDQPGDYQLRLVLDDGICNDTLSKPIHVQSVVHRSEGLAYHIKVYPNPVTDKLAVQVFPLPENHTIEITDINGKVWQTANLKSEPYINVSGLPAGVYVLILKVEGHKHMASKFVKQ